ncbi:MAG: Nif3-like dinuclear metal center hexameric protein [Paludibacter sp.]|nr:Nif3-like dinuclear metal center hexameric protein [Paludibacter sp.]
MKVSEITTIIEDFAPLSLQENYDNAGLLTGSSDMEVSGVLITIDVTEEVVEEAIQKGCNLIVSHHPVIFEGLKKLNGKNYVERTVIKAIKNDIAIYAAHTNLDNVARGVSGKMADLLNLRNQKVLLPQKGNLLKLVVYVPKLHAYKVREAIFEAGAGHIGNYDYCSFNIEGKGTFRANEQANPFVGTVNEMHTENEVRIEVILPAFLKNRVKKALITVHPYEEPAYDFFKLENNSVITGSGIIGELDEAVEEKAFLEQVKRIFQCDVIRHTRLIGKPVKRIALCGGAGSFLIKEAIVQDADAYISGDFKYHEFFDADNKIILADIGHFESEQFTKVVFYEIITKKMPTFAIQISETKTNPINYL